MKLTPEIIKLIETLTSCSIEECDTNYELYVHSDIDFSLGIPKNEDEIENIITQCENYNVDEEFKHLYNSNTEISPRTLLKNCEEIGENLKELKALLKDFDLETFCDIYSSYDEITVKDAYEITQAGYVEVCGTYDDEEDAARNFIEDRIGCSDFQMLEDYIDLNSFFEDVLLDNEGYMRLDSGHIVCCE